MKKTVWTISLLAGMILLLFWLTPDQKATTLAQSQSLLPGFGEFRAPVNEPVPPGSDQLTFRATASPAIVAGEPAGWLVLWPDSPLGPQPTPEQAWASVAPVFAELEAHGLAGELTRLPDKNVARAAWLAPLARQRLRDLGLELVPDTESNRISLGLVQGGACRPAFQATGEQSAQGVSSFVIDTTQDYIEGSLSPGGYITITLRAPNNGIKGRFVRSLYSSNFRVCFETVNLLPGDRLDIQAPGLSPISLTIPNLTIAADTVIDVISGTVPPNTLVFVRAQSPDGDSYSQVVTATAQGVYSVSLAGVYDIVAGSWVQASIQGAHGETYRVSRFLPSRLNVTMSSHSEAYLETAGNVPATLTVQSANGAVRETIQGTTNRIGTVCQSLDNLVMGDTIKAEVEGVTTSTRLPVINVQAGVAQVTGTCDANASVTCSIWNNGYKSVETTSNALGVFMCDFTGVYTPTAGDLVEVTARLAERTARTAVYVPLGLRVSGNWIYAYTRPQAPVSITIREAGGALRSEISGISGSDGAFSRFAGFVFQPGDYITLTSEGLVTAIRTPAIFFDPTADVISGTVEPLAQVSIRVNWGTAIITTANALGQFSVTTPITPGNDIILEIVNTAGASFRMSSYVPVGLSFSYGSADIFTWPNLPGRWQILDRNGQVRAEQTFTTTTSLSDQIIYPGDLISVTVQGQTATLRIPAINVNIDTDTLVGLAQPGAEIKLTVYGWGGDEVVRTLTAAADGTFAASFAIDHDLVPGDAIRIQSNASGCAANVTYYIPARVSMGNSYIYIYTAPLTQTQVVVRDASSQIVLSKTMTSYFSGGVYVYADKDLPAGGTLEIQTAGRSIHYVIQPLIAWIDRERDRLVGNGPPNASLTVEWGWNDYATVQTAGDGSFVLNLAGRRDLRAYSYATIRYFNTAGIEQYYTANGPSISVDVVANTVSGYYLPPGTAIRVKDAAGQIKETRFTPLPLAFRSIDPGDTVEIDYPTGVIAIPVRDLTARLNKTTAEVELYGPPGRMGSLGLSYSGVRSDSGYYTYPIAAGDDGHLNLFLHGIYDFGNNTSLTFCVYEAEGDKVCNSAWSPGLTVNATDNSVSGHIASGTNASVAIRRGALTKGSARLTADETGTFNAHGFCQAGSPIDITTGDRVVLDDEVASINVVGISAYLDLDTDTLFGVGPAGAMLKVSFTSLGGYLGGYAGGGVVGDWCQISCRPLRPSPLDVSSLAQVSNSGTFSLSAGVDLKAGSYVVITYEDDDGDLLQYVTRSTDGSGLEIAAAPLPPSVQTNQTLTVTWTVTGGIRHSVARLYWDTASRACDRNYAYVVEGVSKMPNPVDDGGGGTGGSLSVVATLATTGTYQATLLVPQGVEMLYLRPYAEVDGYPVWAGQEITLTVTAAGDLYEPDDTCAQASPITTDGIPQQHNFHVPGDADWVKFYAVAGSAYILQGSDVGSRVSLVAELYNSCDQPALPGGDLDLGQGFRLVWTCPTSGMYYLRVSNHDPSLFGDQSHYTLSVRRHSNSGVAVIIAGRRDVPEDLLPNFTYVANMAYNAFLNSGFEHERIYYLHPDLAVDANGDGIPDVDAVSSAANLHQAILWAIPRVGPGVPFYLYMVDHGNTDLFYSNTWMDAVNAANLNAWLAQLESQSGCDQVNVIIETCKSGSFIIPPDQLSHPGRVVISSAKADQTAYGLPNGKGAHFSNTFLAQLGAGADLWTAYKVSRDTLWELRNVLNYQQPWLDDNGDGVANEQDGAIAQQRGLLAALGGAVPWIAAVSPSQRISGYTGVITATIYDELPLAEVWAEIYSPSYQPPGDPSSVHTINVPQVRLSKGGANLYAGVYGGFTERGEYRVVIQARDVDGNHAVPKVTTVRTGYTIYLPVVLKKL